MDWRRTDGGGRRMAIAIIRLPARVPPSDPRYGGPVMINPGGPGGSGVDQVLRIAKSLQAVVDSEGDPSLPFSNDGTKSVPLYHDIISFDPRAIQKTTPAVTCFPDSFSRETWQYQEEVIGILGSTEDAFSRNWYRSKALAEGCSARLISAGEANGTDDRLGEHVNTTPVIRDMLEIIERHADWVKDQQPADILITTGRKKTPSTERDEPAKIKYWGFSYGTIIGQTFAAVYPNHVARLIVDGVVDADYYYNGPWNANLWDADKILEKFFDYCQASGDVFSCPFYASGGRDAIKETYYSTFERIKTTPFAVPASSTRGPDVITWSDAKSMVRLGMYQPHMYFPLVARLLADITTGNGSAFADFKQARHSASCPTEECKLAGAYSPECIASGHNNNDATKAILCTDAEGIGDITQDSFVEYWMGLRNQSEVLGDWWAHTRLDCVGWKAKAAWRFAGPFQGNTSYPMLWLSNTLDPVTPIRNAKRMMQNFPGSVLLEQDAEGHCTTSAKSLCTAKHVRAYFQTGEMPEPGTVCGVEEKPFLGNVGKGNVGSSKADEVLLEAWEQVGKAVLPSVSLRRMGIM